MRRCKGLREVRDLSGVERVGWEAEVVGGEEERNEGSKMSPGRKVMGQDSLSL
jgi:hypothetical protein